MTDWMSGAVKHPGRFSAKAKTAGKSTEEYAKEESGAPGALGEEARLAETFAKYRPRKGKKKPVRRPNAFYGE